MAAEKIFCGSGKKIEFPSGGHLHRVNICLNDLEAHPEFITTLDNGKRFVNLNLVSRKAPDERGNTHYVCIDTYRKENNKPAANTSNNQEEVPFE